MVYHLLMAEDDHQKIVISYANSREKRWLPVYLTGTLDYPLWTLQ